MSYLIKEIFGPTIQGEGAHTGRPCVFLRFAVCNLACTWCDTDFRPEGATKMTAEEIVAELVSLDRHNTRMVVVSGGEPALQWDQPLADALADAGFRAHMETNGTRALKAPVHWLTVSPKPRFHEGKNTLVDLPASECKVVVDESVTAEVLADYEARYPCDTRYLQPCMDDQYDENLRRTIAMVTENPRWRMSVQLHKIIDVP